MDGAEIYLILEEAAGLHTDHLFPDELEFYIEL